MPRTKTSKAYSREDLLDALALTPCREPGHDPHTGVYVCEAQKAAAFGRALTALGIEEDDLPRRADSWTGATTLQPEVVLREYAWLAGAPLDLFQQPDDGRNPRGKPVADGIVPELSN